MNDETREMRIGMNEAVFRELNEQIEQLAPDPQRELKLVCECGSSDCHRRLRMSSAAYEALRADSCLFAVAPGHEIPEVETVEEDRGGYLVIRKRDGVPASVARSTDPRR